jgi:hypothetical protein
MFAHPAAAVTLRSRLGRFGVLSALVMGSLAPDMHYVLPLPVDRAESHSLAGLLWFCLPVSFAMYLVFHLVLKLPLLLLLPPSVAGRLAPFVSMRSLLPKVSWAGVVVSLCVGALTHLAWDAFTHSDGLATRALPILRAHMFFVDRYNVHLYQVLQHASSVTGVALLALWSWRWLRAAPLGALQAPLVPSARQRTVIFSFLFGCAGLLAVLSAGSVWSAPMSIFVVQDMFRGALLTAISVLALACLAYSVVWHVLSWPERGGH